MAGRMQHESMPPAQATRRAVAIAMSIGWVWVFVLIGSSLVQSDWFPFVLLANGPVAGAYLAVLYWVRGSARNQAAATLVAVFSTCHIFWLVVVGFALVPIFEFTEVDDGVALMAITAVGYAAALGIASLSLLPVGAMLAAGILAAAMAAGDIDFSLGIAGGFAGGCATLHAVMVTTIAWETLTRPLSRTPGICANCGYSLTGLPEDTPCPECGPECQR